MPRRPRLRQCPRCGRVHPSTAKACADCGTSLARTRWRMDAERIRYVHGLALRQKGLTYEEYKLRLGAVGVDTCKALSARQYSTFVRGLRRLPDVRRAGEGR